MSDKWRVFKWASVWVAKYQYRTFEAATWREAYDYAVDDKRDERF